MEYQFNREYVLGFLQEIVAMDSPAGYTEAAALHAVAEAESLGFKAARTNKGGVVITVPGREKGKTVGLCAHLDTLGLMVRSVKDNGRLAVTSVGSPLLPTLDGEYCRIYTRNGKTYTGTILSTSASMHVYRDSTTKERTLEYLEVRVDEKVKDVEETRALGIAAGDYVCYDAKAQITESGFIKSRFLDDKIGVASLFGVLQAIKTGNLMPQYDTCVLLSVYEEVGHGMAHLPVALDELLGVDMGCIGADLGCAEWEVSICAKDSTGPYDYELTNRLVELCKQNGIAHALDIYPDYGSDVSAARAAGNDVRGALIGPGVHGSHGMERTHYEGVVATMQLLCAYLRLQ